MNDSLLEQLRELHSPEANYGDLQCDGCDWGGYEGEAPTWPCRTAALVYTVEEIADIERDFRWWEHWGRARRYRHTMATQPWRRSVFGSIFGAEHRFIADQVFPNVPAERTAAFFTFHTQFMRREDPK